MRILVAAHGTRGDVQPAFVIADALAAAGHQVRLAAPRSFSSWAERAPWAVSFAEFPVDVAQILGDPGTRRTLETGSARRFFSWAEQVDRDHGGGLADSLVASSDGVDAIVAHPMLADRAFAVAEYRRFPMLMYSTLPLWRTREFAPLLMGGPRLGPLNGIAHSIYLRLHWRSHGPAVNSLRRKLGLSPAQSPYLAQAQARRLPSLETYSSTLCPKPADWGDERTMTGLLRVPERLRGAFGESALPPELEAWLGQGTPPVFVSFGSMPLMARPGLVQAIAGVLAACGQRGVLGLGWTRAEVAGDRLLVVGEINHSLLLPRCRAAVHHGGAGITAAAAEAGVPSIVCPAFVDQPFWARRVEALGIGVRLPYRRLDAARFRRALERVLEMGGRAQEIGARVRREDGVTGLAAHVERGLQAGR